MAPSTLHGVLDAHVVRSFAGQGLAATKPYSHVHDDPVASLHAGGQRCCELSNLTIDLFWSEK